MSMSTRFNFTDMRHGTSLLKRGFAKMQEGGVIMDVVTPEEAHIAEDAGAVSVMALERVPADIRAQGGVARMSHPDMIKEIIETTSIPVMAKARIGHDDEAKVLQSLGVDMIDESEVLTPADPFYHIAKNDFTIPFVCGCTNLGEAIRRVAEGAAMIRTKGEAGTGNVVSAVQHARLVKEAKTAKKVAFKCAGAFFAIQASKGIMDTCPNGDSNAVFIKAINFASTTPPVKEDVQL